MTDREKAIVMAHTGVCMLAGDKFQIFHKYIEEIMGSPVWTHEIGFLEKEIKEKSKADFIALCADESSSENPNKWISVSERLPDERKNALLLLRVGMLALCVMPQTYTELINMIFATKKARQVGTIMTASGDITAETMLLRGCRYPSHTRQKVRIKHDD